jgi:transcriptional regulator with XRE-family HTH domain
MAEPLIVNNLRAERIAAGIDTVEELAERAGIDPTWCAYIEDGKVLATNEELRRLLAALGGIPENRVYERTWRQLTMMGQQDRVDGLAQMWKDFRDAGHVLISPDEVNYFERDPGPGHQAEVYVNLSCGTQRSPHLLQDTVSVLEALGVAFVAAAGPAAACCGKSIALVSGKEQVYERFRQGRVDRSVSWGATTHVNFCGACQQIATAVAARHELADGVVHPVREVQLIPFLEERVRELGDRVPWKKEVRRRVLAEGHPGMGNVHSGSQASIARLLAMVPGVEAVGLYDGWSELSPCAVFGLEGSPPPAWTLRPETPAEVAEHRHRLADEVHARGADTVSCMHQTCHQMWSRYASDRLAVVHPVSVLAEALDRAHPDRFQAAVRRGDPQALVEESRPRWQSWGMTEARAHEMADSICDLMTVANMANGTYQGSYDESSFAMIRRRAAGFGCVGGCGGCQAHAGPEVAQLAS